MKNFTLGTCFISFLLFSMTFHVKAQDITGDYFFLKAIKDNHLDDIDTDGDGAISQAEAAAYEGTLDVSKKIPPSYTIRGIEYFPKITMLICSYNQLAFIDISKNTALQSLYCQNNSILSSLDVSQNTSLKYLNCSNNRLSKLDVSQNTSLKDLYCQGNRLESLDVSQNTSLFYLDCSDNQLSTLELGNISSLRRFFCNENCLSSLDLGQNNIDISSFGYGNNKFPFSVIKPIHDRFPTKYYSSDSTIFSPQEGSYGFKVDYSTEALFDGNKTVFKWYDESDTEVDDTAVKEQETDGVFQFLKPGVYYCKMTNTALSWLELQTEPITINIVFPDQNFKTYLVDPANGINTDGDQEISQSEAAALEILNVSSKDIADLTGIEYFINLKQLNCYGNQLESLDVSKNTALSYLVCSRNKLTELNLQTNTALTTMVCENNLLVNLDVSKNTALDVLVCNNNQLNSLDVTKNTVLRYIFFNNNNISSLDISQIKKWVFVELKNNKFPFSELKKIYYHINAIDYSSDSTIFSKTGGSDGFMVDYSEEVLINGNTTTFDWYNEDGTEVGDGVIEEVSPGIFEFPVEGTYYCVMKNASFPDAELQTEPITISGELLNIPDENFRQALLDNPEVNTLDDGVISVAEASAFKGVLNVSGKSIADLTGIEYFINLKQLNCYGNQLESLDVSKNTELTHLTCGVNRLSSLDLSNNSNLIYIGINYNRFPFSALQQIKNDFGPFDYTPNKIFSEKTGEGLGFEVDYSEEVLGNTTTFVWYDENGVVTVGDGAIEEVSPGVFEFLEAGVYYCKMTNTAFPGVELQTEDISIDEYIAVPDPNFKAYLVDPAKGIDTDGDQEISKSEAAALEMLSVSSKSIADLTGIEYFTKITTLICSNNNLSSLNVSKNTALESLHCNSNQLSSLNVSKNTSLEELDCSRNQLESLDVSQNPNLWMLYCHYNLISSLDVSQNTALIHLSCMGNQISGLNVSRNTNLKVLACYENPLSSLDISQNSALQSLSIYSNKFPFSELKKMNDHSNVNATNYFSDSTIFSKTEGGNGFVMDYSEEVLINGNTTTFAWFNENGAVSGTAINEVSSGVFEFLEEGTYYCVMKNATFPDAELQTETITISCELLYIPDENFRQALLDNPEVNTFDDNLISVAEASAFTGALNVPGKSIADLTGIEYFPNITGLDCSSNQLGSLDITSNTLLTYLNCRGNQLGSLGVSQNTALDTLICSSNQLNTLDVSKNTALTYLACMGNQLSVLDVSQNTELKTLGCITNSLSSLDVTKNTKLTYLACSGNSLTSLDVSQNTLLEILRCNDNQLSNLDLSQNTAFTEEVWINNNKLPFSVVKLIKEQFPDLAYTSNLTIFSPQEGSYGFELDYSSEALFDENQTTFIWYDDNDAPVESNIVEEQETKGVFRFLYSGTYYCKMENGFFPGAELQTEPITINKTTIEIPDPIFKAYLVGRADIDTDKNGEISISEAAALKSNIMVSYKKISDLTGIEYFINITKLDCSLNSLSSLDVSKNTNLVELNCAGNPLTGLDVSKNTNLVKLNCGYTQLSSLDVSNLLNLEKLYCYGKENNESGTGISSLDVSQNTALKVLHCSNNLISSLDVSQNTALEELLCYDNQLRNLDLSQNPAIWYLQCDFNQLSSLDLSHQGAKITYLRCNNNRLTDLDVSQNTDLQWLVCNNNLLTDLDVVSTDLYASGLGLGLNCNHNKFLFSTLKPLKDQFSDLDYISDSTIFSPQENLIGFEVDYSGEALFHGNETTFTWYDESDTELDDTAVEEQETGIFRFLQAGTYYCKMKNATFPNTELQTETITIYQDRMIAIPDENFKAALVANGDINTDGDAGISISEAFAFTGTISVSDKEIENLTGIEYFHGITKLSCEGNQLTSLDLSKNTALQLLYCDGNNLSSLILGNKEQLSILECNENELSSLDLSRCLNITELLCADNSLDSIIFHEGTAFEKNNLLVNSNRFPLSALDDIKDHYPETWDYQSGKKIFSPQEKVVGLEVDYSAEVSFENSAGTTYTTEFSWYDDSNNEVDASFVEEQGTPGVFRFLKAGTYYCKMFNDAVYDYAKSALPLQTEPITVYGDEIIDFPDENFKAALVANGDINTNGDSEISLSEAFAFTEPISVTGKGIADLTGIEYFINIPKLYCSGNSLTVLDVTENTALTFLSCANNQLKSLDVSKNTSLNYLYCSFNLLVNLNLSHNIEDLDCSNNQLSSLNVSLNTNLEDLDCSNNELSSLNLGQNTSLEELYCSYNELISLDVSMNTSLRELDCSNNELSNLVGLNTNLEELYCSHNKLISLDVGMSTNLNSLNCSYNELIGLDVSKNTLLERLTCNNNQLSSLAPGQNTSLWSLKCSYNRLRSLDVSQNTGLISLYCNQNKFPFSEVKLIKDNFKNLGYASDSTIFTPLTGAYGFEVDYSAEVSFDGKTTVFTWYDDSGNVVEDESIIAEQSNGVFRFLYPGTYHCIMTNATFNGAELETEPITINKTILDIPDPNFKAYLADRIDTDGDTEISLIETLFFTGTSINVTQKGIADLTGIEYFPNIIELRCSSNQLNSLDVSQNTALTHLYCDDNQLGSLNISGSTELIYLNCNENQLGSLDISQNTALTHLYCDDNQLGSLDISDNMELIHLDCNDNQLGSLNIGQNTALTHLHCDNNLLSSLNVRNTLLESLSCSGNQLSNLNISGNMELTYLNCSYNRLGSLDISQNTALTHLHCDNNLLSSLNVSGNRELSYLNCNSNRLSSLDVSGMALENLLLNHNKFLFSTLKPVKDEFSNLAYISDSLIFTPQAGGIGFEVDYSTEASFNGKETTFTWYDNSGNQVADAVSGTNGVFRFLHPGTFYCKMENEHFPGSLLQTETITITGDWQEITFNNLPASVEMESCIELSATASSGLEVSFVIVEGNEIATLTGNTLDCNESGIITIKAIQEGNDQFAAVEKEAPPITITKKAQNISFNPITEAKVNDVVTLEATATSNLDVRFEVSQGDATINGSTITFNQEGEVVIKAIQDGNNRCVYTETSATITVSKKEQHISFENLITEVRVNDVITLKAIASSNLDVRFEVSQGDATINGSTITFNQEGEVVIKAIQDGDNQCVYAETSATITVSKKEQKINFINLVTKVKVNDEIELSATTDSGLDVSFEVTESKASLEGNTLTFNEEGSVILKAIQEGNDEFIATEETVTITVEKREQSIYFTSVTEANVNDVIELSATATSGLDVCFELLSGNASLNGNLLTLYEAGKVSIRMIQDGNEEFILTEELVEIIVSNESLSKNSVTIYPNPVVDEVNISFKDNSLKMLSLYNLAGQKLIQTETYSTKTINISNYESGIYILKVQSGHLILTYKIIKN